MRLYFTKLFLILLLLVTSCEEMEYDHVLIVVTDKEIQVPVNADAVTLKGAILDIGKLPVIQYGFCYRDSVPDLILTIEGSNTNNIILTDKPEISSFEKKIRVFYFL